MAKIDVREVLIEKAERDGDLCQCGAAAEEGFDPHCMTCATYWRDVDDGLFQDYAWEQV